jgi:hypothetical protein
MTEVRDRPGWETLKNLLLDSVKNLQEVSTHRWDGGFLLMGTTVTDDLIVSGCFRPEMYNSMFTTLLNMMYNSLLQKYSSEEALRLIRLQLDLCWNTLIKEWKNDKDNPNQELPKP